MKLSRIYIKSIYGTKNVKKGLAELFLDIFSYSIDLIKDFPLINPKKYDDFHSFIMHKFPYLIYYIMDQEKIIIMGIVHQSRNPNFIKSLLNNRKKN